VKYPGGALPTIPASFVVSPTGWCRESYDTPLVYPGQVSDTAYS